MSLRELWNVRRAANARQKDVYERDIGLAWNIEAMNMRALQRDGSRRLPALSTLLGQTAKGHKQSWQDIKATITAMTEGVIPN